MTEPTLEEMAELLAQLEGRLSGCGSAELSGLLTAVDRVAATAAAARVLVTAEALWRGVPGEQDFRPVAWVREFAPSTRQGGAAGIARLAEDAARTARRRSLTGAITSPPDGLSGQEENPRSAVSASLDPDTPLGVVWDQVRTGRAAVPLTGVVRRQADRLKPYLRPEALAVVTGTMLDVGVEFGPRAVEELKVRLLAEHGNPDEVDNLQEHLSTCAFLSEPDVSCSDLTEYRMALTPEQAALLEAAIGPGAAPCPNEETGEPDPRSSGQRRAESLITLCLAAVARDGEHHGTDGVAGSAMALTVTMTLNDLRQGLGLGEVGASRASGTLLSPSRVRQLACDCELIPAVLGTDSEILDWGQVHRLFTKGQRRLIWHRDRHCTYPGCTAPATWTRVHHLHHWLDGGPTNVNNAALLCQHHHTIVHRRRLWAHVHTKPDEHGRHVTWDLTPGSYDHALRRLQKRPA